MRATASQVTPLTAAQQEMEASMDQHSEIPMLTVVKKNAILKNIFLLSPSEIHPEDPCKIRQDSEQALMVGRHPDCQIRLEHPSISRFHLRIHIKRSHKRLSVTDLSSVHGTWISSKRIEPNVRVDVVEGDALRIGLSSRVYMLHWVPFYKACNLNKPINPLADEAKHEALNRNGHATETELQSAGSALMASNDLVSDQLKSSQAMEDVNIMIYNNEDGNVMELECESKEKPVVTNPFETSKAPEDLNIMICNNEDGNVLELECESKDKALVTNPFETLKEPEDEDELVCKNEDAKIVSVSKAPQLEDTKDGDDENEVLVDENALLVEPGDMEDGKEKEVNCCGLSTGPEKEHLIDQYKENEEDKENSQHIRFEQEGLKEPEDEDELVCKNEDAKIVDSVSKVPQLEATKDGDDENEVLVDENALLVEPGDMEDGKEKEVNCCGLSTGPEKEHLIDQFKENEEDKENSQHPRFEQEGLEISNGKALSSHLTEYLDSAETESSFNAVEEDDAAWSFWFLGSEMIATENNFVTSGNENEGENARKEINFSEDHTSVGNESLLWSFWCGTPKEESVYSSSFSETEALSQIDSQLMNANSEPINTLEKLCKSEVSSPDILAQNICSSRGHSTSAPQIRTEQVDKENEVLNGAGIKPITRVLFDGMGHPEGYFTPEKVNHNMDTQCGIDVDKSLYDYSKKENQTPKFLQGQKSSCQLSLEHKKMSVLEKREAHRAPLQSLFPESPQMSISGTEISGSSLSIYSSKENKKSRKKSACHFSAECSKLLMPPKRESQRTPLQALCANSPRKTIHGTHNSGAASLTSYSNKENLTPKFLQEQKSASPSSGERMPCKTLFVDSPQKPSDTHDSPQKTIFGTHVSGVASLTGYSKKENLTLKFLQEQTSASHLSAERMPCKTLFVDSPQKLSGTQDSIGPSKSKSGNSTEKSNHLVRRVKRWTMVIDDINSLLDKNSRKSLQLLEGIKGTQLIIPTAVVCELDFLKQQASIFRRNTDAFLASQWIEECLARTKWWIQIQNITNDFGESTEDQVLNYALALRSIKKDDDQLVILSDDVTRKIKAMEEGLICESAEEFRKSLINPFSKRFLWAGSSPRGRTWSCLDDVIVRNHFYHEGYLRSTLKGLKLIPLM